MLDIPKDKIVITESTSLTEIHALLEDFLARDGKCLGFEEKNGWRILDQESLKILINLFALILVCRAATIF